MKNLFLFFSALCFLSCSTDYVVLNSSEAIILSADSSSRTMGQPITFTVTNNSGDVLTDEAVIYVNGTAIEGAVFTSEVVGTFEVTAVYATTTSAPVIINFHDGSETNFVKRVLIEDYTGTWCGYCPRVAHGIELIKNQTQNFVPVAIHRASLSPTDPSYDPYTFDSSELESVINIAGYPKGMLNRMTQWDFPEPENISQVVALTQGENPKLGLAIASSVNNGMIAIDVSTMFSKDFENLKLVVYVLENGLIHEQHNYTDYYNSENIIANFEHNHVLRACLTPLMGEAINNSETVTGNVYKRTFNVPVPATVANAANIEFVAFIVGTNNKAVNVRKALPGENQQFEEL